MHNVILIYLALVVLSIEASVRPKSAVFGALQTPPPSRGSAYQFVGVYDPGNGIYWNARRRPRFEGTSRWLQELVNAVRFRDPKPLRDDCPREYLYRILILDKLNAIKNATKQGLVSLSLDGNRLTVTKNGFLRKLANNRY